MTEKSKEFSAKEAKQRFEAALRGSRNVGPQPMKNMSSKREPARREATGKKKK
jgi:hypothetical protein